MLLTDKDAVSLTKTIDPTPSQKPFIKILDYTQVSYMTYGIRALVTNSMNTTDFCSGYCIILPRKTHLISDILAAKHTLHSNIINIIILSEHLATDFASALLGLRFRVIVLSERVSPLVLMTELNNFNRNHLRITRRLPRFTQAETRLLIKLKSTPTLIKVAMQSDNSIKTISAHKRNIMFKIGVTSNIIFMYMLNDPNLLHIISCLID